MTVYSDASYLVNCLGRGWYEKWRENGWLNHRKEPVANRSHRCPRDLADVMSDQTDPT